jgi:hypothetical protein
MVQSQLPCLQQNDARGEARVCRRMHYVLQVHIRLRALSSKNFMVLDAGYDLDALQKRMVGVKLKSVEECCEDTVLKTVRRYLLEDGLRGRNYNRRGQSVPPACSALSSGDMIRFEVPGGCSIW